MPDKQDSNTSSLSIAEEVSFKTLVGSAADIWLPQEPNTYPDFGGDVTLIARNPINASRQRKKGVITDLDASGGFTSDITQNSLTTLMQGFLFADARKKVNLGGASEVTSVDGTLENFVAASGLDAFNPGDLVLAENFIIANNGLHTVTAAAAAALTVGTDLTTEASPAAGALLTQVGFEFGSGEVEITAPGGFPTLSRLSGTKDFTDFNLNVGEWIHVGGDVAASIFATAANNGFARVRSIATTVITFDKTQSTMVADNGVGKTIQLFFGEVQKNENLPANQVRRTYNIERTLGSDGVGIQSEYLEGAVPDILTFNIGQADKATVDMSYQAGDNVQRTGTQGLKPGTRPALAEADAFNTSSDFSRLKMSLVSGTDSAPTPLFAFLTEVSVAVGNNISPNKALTVLGAFDMTAGSFDVSGTIRAYFSDVTAIQAVRNNSDVTFDFILAKQNAGIAIDIPLVALGGGKLDIQQDQAITVPLNMDAGTGAKIDVGLDHTLLVVFFKYLPTIAE